MNTRQIVKFVTTAITAIGAYGITRQVIDNNTDEPESRSQELLQKAGSAAVAGLVADAASDRTDRMVDELFDIFEGRKTSDSDN